MQHQTHQSMIGSFMNSPRVNHWVWSGVVAIAMLAGGTAQAQVIPDATLGAGNNSVTSTTGNRTDILGGLRRNSSLFHSFDRFDVLTNQQVYFANPADIRNIFSRVTGGNISNIDGLLGVSGSANLFLMNPNGIIFGPNARLDVAGSFLATTANALEFADNQKFAATGDRVVPLVEVNIPIGLQMGTNAPAMLTNRGNLAVGPGQSLTLVGGDTINTGALTASGGTVQVLGRQVALLDNSQIDVSSPTGGGTVLVGGGYQGRGAWVNAQSTTVGQNAVIKADALTNGNGGRVIVWADGDTRFNGSISAQGGIQYGNGGFVEVSGRQRLAFQGQVDTRAVQGQPGNLLLDPSTITIAATGGITAPIPPTGNGDFTVDLVALQNALSNGPITLQADDSITVSSTINSSGNANTLTFATQTINLNASIDITGNLNLTADNITGSGNLSVDGITTLAFGNDNITLDSANDFNTVNITSAGAVTLNDSNNIILGTTNVAGGLNITTNGTITQNGNLTVGGTTTLAADTNDIILGGTNDFNTVQITSGSNVDLNDINNLNLGTSNVSGNLNVTSNSINLPNAASITSNGGNIQLVGTTSVTSSGSLNTSGRTVEIFGGQIQLLSGSTINVSGDPTGGTVSINGSQVVILPTATINANSTGNGQGGNVTVVVPTPQNAVIFPTNITANGSPNGTITLPSSPASIGAGAFSNIDPNTSDFENIRIIDGNDQSIIALFQPLIPIGILPFIPVDPILYQFYAGTIYQDFQIPRTMLEGVSTSVLSTLFTGQNIIFAARNNITVENLTADQLMLVPAPTPGISSSIQFAAGGVFAMNQGDSIQTSGRSIAITANGVNTGVGDNSLIIGGINASSGTTVGGNIRLNAVNGNIAIGNGIIPARVLSNSTNNLTAASSIQVEAGVGSVSLSNAEIRADSNGLAGKIFINAANTITADRTTISANGQFGGISIGASPPGIADLRPDNILIQNNSDFSAENDLTAFPAPVLVAGAVDVRANTSIQVNQSRLSSSASGSASAGAVQIQTTGESSGTIISLSDADLESTASGSGGAGAINLENANTITLNGSRISNTVVDGSGGLTKINGGTISISGASTIRADTTGQGKAGEIILSTENGGDIVVGNSQISARSRAAVINPGGAGKISLTASNSRITIDGSAISNEVVGGTGDNITIDTGTVALQNGATVNASTSGNGSAGKISITATAPNPDATTSALTIADNSQVQARSSGGGAAGAVSLQALSGDITIRNSSTVSSETSGDGNSGSVEISGQNLSILGGSGARASSAGAGAPGSVSVVIANNIVVSGTSASGQISEISTFSGTVANLGNTDAGNIRINQLGRPVRDLQLSDRGRINASTQSINPIFTGGNIQVYAGNLRIINGGQIIASSLDDRNPATGQARAGNINITANTINIAGSAPAFADDPNFSSAVILRQLGNTTFSSSNAFLSTGSGAVPVSNLTSTLNLAENTIPIGATNGSAIQLSALGDTPRQLSFGWTFLTNEFPGAFNDASFVVDGQTPSPLASVNEGVASVTGNDFQASATPGFLRQTANQSFSVTSSNPITIGVVNVADTAVASGLQLNNIQLDGNPIQALVFSPDLNRTQPFISGIFARADGTGNAGSVAISGVGSAANLALQNGAQISTSTDTGGQMSPSSITLTGLNNLTVSGNSLISTATNSGRAGDVQIDVMQGTAPAITLTGNSGIVAEARQGGTAGNVDIGAGQFTVQNGARVSVSSPTGQAGSLEVITNDLRLTRGTLEAVSGIGDGANITLTINPGGLLLMRNGSLISADASDEANGGNITISAPFVIGPTFENNDIVANAIAGNGGQINITTNAIFGLQFRRERTSRSDITARSETGASGVVALNTLNIDPSKGLVELPEVPVDRANQLTQGCSTGGDPKNNESRFSVAGRGGVPPSPTAPFTAATASDWVSLAPSPQTLSGITFSNSITMDLVAQSDRIPVTCINAWKLQQRSLLPTSSTHPIHPEVPQARQRAQRLLPDNSRFRPSLDFGAPSTLVDPWL